MSRRFAIVALMMLLAGRAAAHPVPALTYDRTVRIKLTPAGVEATYRLELNDYTMLVDGAQIISDEQRATLTERSERPAELKDRRDVNRTDEEDARLREISAKFTAAAPATATPAAEAPAEVAVEQSIVTKMRRGGLSVLLDSELGL